MIEVNIVYVDAEGRIEDGHGHRFEDQNSIARILYKTYRKGSIEEQAQWNIERSHFYTIEPIQVKLQHQYHHGMTNEWYDCGEGVYNKILKFEASEVRIVARIVTEEEKPVFQMPTINVIGAPCARCTSRQPAPVVDKPDLKLPESDPEVQAWLNSVPEEVYDFANKLCQELRYTGMATKSKMIIAKAFESTLQQQPTEWIPVSEPPKKGTYVLTALSISLGEKGSVIENYFQKTTGKFFDHNEKVIAWRYKPEPPKP